MVLAVELLILFFLNMCLGYPFDISNELTSNNVSFEPDESAGRKLKEWSENDIYGNPEEQGPYFEGDIIISNARNGAVSPKQTWINGIIPYEIDGEFTPAQIHILNKAFKHIKWKTCIKLIPRVEQEDYVVFKNDMSGCWSRIGKEGGRQVINLQSPCMKRIGTIIHEIVHAIGFYHEQNRSDRDKYVRVIRENIPKNKLVNFVKLNNDQDNNFGVEYDYGSVMHYSTVAFSVNGEPTIESKSGSNTSDKMGQRIKLSDGDILKINRMYNCSTDQ